MIQKVEISWRHGDQEGAIPVEVVYSKRRTIGQETGTSREKSHSSPSIPLGNNWHKRS